MFAPRLAVCCAVSRGSGQEISRLEQAPRRSGSTTILKCWNGAELVPAYEYSALAEPVAHHKNETPMFVDRLFCWPKKPDAESRRMLPAFHHRVRPRTVMTSVGTSFHFALHVANINVFQRWLFDFNGSDIRPLLKLSHL